MPLPMALDHINVYLTEGKSLPSKRRQRYHRTRKEYEAYFEEIIRQVQKDGKSGLFKGLDPRIVKLGILGMCNWIIVWYKEEGPSTPDEIYDAFRAIITEGPFGRLNEGAR